MHSFKEIEDYDDYKKFVIKEFVDKYSKYHEDSVYSDLIDVEKLWESIDVTYLMRDFKYLFLFINMDYLTFEEQKNRNKPYEIKITSYAVLNNIHKIEEDTSGVTKAWYGNSFKIYPSSQVVYINLINTKRRYKIRKLV